jgi:hypothetical protein
MSHRWGRHRIRLEGESVGPVVTVKMRDWFKAAIVSQVAGAVLLVLGSVAFHLRDLWVAGIATMILVILEFLFGLRIPGAFDVTKRSLGAAFKDIPGGKRG